MFLISAPRRSLPEHGFCAGLPTTCSTTTSMAISTMPPRPVPALSGASTA